MNGPALEWDKRLARGELRADAAQTKAIAALERLHVELCAASPPLRGWRRELARLRGARREPVRGIYLWGSVGRGKTLMMDLLFNCLPFEDKLRRHFHRFMAQIHENLKSVREQANPLEIVADRLAAQTRIICFDEFAVTDIADAMLLGNLFSALFARGVTLAATSNIEPKDLYRDGLQRQQFLPAIELIERHTEVLHVDGRQDYRLRVLERADVFQFPADAAAERRLEDYFVAIAPDRADEDGSLEVLGRPIPFRKSADGVIWFDFDALCDGPRSQDDYIELARCCQTVLVSNVPQFDSATENQARRFIALVDEFYDRRVKLILSAAVSIEKLYRGARLMHDFQRTRSRLQEMQSHDYLAAAHRT